MTTSAAPLDDAVLDRLEAAFLEAPDPALRRETLPVIPVPGWWDSEDEELSITRYRTLNRGCCG